jgi:hypothetical protein
MGFIGTDEPCMDELPKESIAHIKNSLTIKKKKDDE